MHSSITAFLQQQQQQPLANMNTGGNPMHMPATQALLQQKSRVAANMSSNAAEPLNTEESWSPQSAQVLDSLT